MNSFFIGIGEVQSSSVKLNGYGCSFMFLSGRDVFYISGVQIVPVGRVVILGRLYSFRGRDCQSYHVGVRPLVVLPADRINSATLCEMWLHYISPALGCLRANKKVYLPVDKEGQ